MHRSDFISKLMKDQEHSMVLDNGISKRNEKTIETEEYVGNLFTERIHRKKNIFLFVDTCTWLNYSSKGDFESFVTVADLHLQYDAILLVPEQLKIEWNRNKEDTIVKSEKNTFKDILKKTQKFRDNFVQDAEQKEHLTNLIKETEMFQEQHIEYVSYSVMSIVEEIMDMGIKLNTTNEIKVAAADWALQKHAPFHKNKNSIGDSILFLSLINFLKSKSNSILYFVTDNKDDFSDKSNPQTLHSDLRNFAANNDVQVNYYLSLNDALQDILNEVTDEAHIENYKKRFYDMLPKCEKCTKPITKKYEPWDGEGKKIYYECEYCGYKFETGTYEHQSIYDSYY